jgi:hypothetical protein
MADIVYTDAGTAQRRAEDPEIQQTLDAAYERYKAGTPDGTIYTDPNGKVVNFGSQAAPAPANKPDVAEKKTENTSSASPFTSSKNQYAQTGKKNVLHGYRSWTYNFALGAVAPDAVGNISQVKSSINKFLVLSSAGKGTKGMGTSDVLNQQAPNSQKNVAGLVGGFNKNSPGRFDMYIDNVDIDSLIGAGTPAAGSSQATSIGFDVFEPYSINGFIEALQVASQAAGYSDYMKGVFALRFQFQGYRDNQNVAESRPEVIPGTERYFIITITSVEVVVDERGTRYKISATPTNQMGFGSSNKLIADVKLVGNTVGEILENFFQAVTDMFEGEKKAGTDTTKTDSYRLSVPAVVDANGKQNVEQALLFPKSSKSTSNSYQNKKLLESPMSEKLRSTTVFKAGDAAAFAKGYVASENYTPTPAPATPTPAPKADATKTADPSTGGLLPNVGTVVFSKGAQIHDCIAAVIRDSEYVRKNVLDDNVLSKAKAGDNKGMLPYFSIRQEVALNKGYDNIRNKYFRTYTYVLEPYLIHYTRIPGQEQGTFDASKLKGSIQRSYDYIYAGKNVDVLKFNLKFDTLYYSGLPAMLGNRKVDPGTAAAGGATKELDTKAKPSAIAGKKDGASSVPTASSQTDPDLTNAPDITGNQNQGDPYYRMAQGLHNALLNSVDTVQGTLDILGDPYFLVTGGMATENLQLQDSFLTKSGEAAVTQGDLFININYRNPIDIGANGMMQFDSNLIPFSGIYRLLTLKSHFKDGSFTQSLDIIRMPGQIVGKSTPTLANNIKTSPLKGEQQVKSTAPATVGFQGLRPNDFSLGNLLGKGFASFDLPGSVAITGILASVKGAVGQATVLSSQLGISPLIGVNALSSGFRLAASGLTSVVGTSNLTAASGAVDAAGGAIGQVANVKNAAEGLATNITNNVKAIGDNAIAVGTQAVTGITNAGASAYNAVAGIGQSLSTLGTDVAGVVGKAKDSLYAVQNSFLNDPAAVGAKLGIDSAAITGLASNLQNKLTAELASVASLVPDNVNLKDVANQGIALGNIAKDKLANLPAIALPSIAPQPLIDSALASMEKAGKSAADLLKGATNLSPLTDFAGIKNAIGGATAGLAGGFGDVNAMVGQITAAQNQANAVIGSAMGVANNVGTLGQNALSAVNPADVNLGSVESNLANVKNIVQDGSNYAGNLAKTAAAQYGSLQKSPIAKLIQDSNNNSGWGEG